MMTTTSMDSPSNKHRFDDDGGLSSALSPAPLRRCVGDEVGAELPLEAEAAVSPPIVEKVLLVPQDNCDSDGEGNDDLGSDDGEGSGINDGDGEGIDRDDSEDKAMCIPFKTTPSRVMWYKCPICLREEYDSEAKVVSSNKMRGCRTWSNSTARCCRPDDDDMSSLFIVI
jgi:hypothetical protein